MVEIKSVIFTNSFENDVKKIKDGVLREKIKKKIRKIIANPDVGKPLKYGFKGERTVYVAPFRIIYSLSGDKLILLKFEHRKTVYAEK